jgi:50S ribosomal protein L16 3-hydroxylase
MIDFSQLLSRRPCLGRTQKKSRTPKPDRSRKPDFSSAGTPGLATLFGTAPFEEDWQSKPRVFHHDEFLAPEIWHLPDLRSLPYALNIAAPDTVFANLPDRDEEYNQIQLFNPDDVLKAYACKMCISLEPDMHKLTELVFWLRAIQRDLGLAKDTYARCNIYAIPDGGRTACHYDQNINFVCQITGEKTWDLAPNTHIANPVTRHTAGTPADRATTAHSKKELPQQMPSAGRIRVVLKPGSVLYVPRGYWHQTSSKGESIALNFTYDQVSWAQVLSKAICEKLMKDEKWRSVAYGLRSESPSSQRAQAEFEALLRKSGVTLGQVSFEDLA